MGLELMHEVWRPVVGWEGFYEVSDQGQVRSMQRRMWSTGGRAPAWRTVRERILKPGTNVHGYLFVILSRGGKQFTRTVHSLVAEAFIGPRPDGQEVRHGALGKAVNIPSNLSYGTHSENMRDCLRDGTHQHGERGSGAKLTPEAVTAIRLLKGKKLQREVAALFGISRSSVSHLWNEKTWRSV